MHSKLIRYGRIPLLLSLLALVMSVPTLLAHGGGTLRVDAAPAGPYELSIWTLPEPLQVGEVTHVTAFLFDREIGDATDGIVLDADIEVVFQPADGEAITIPATHDNADLKYLYEAELELPSAGTWEIVVNAAAPKGSGSASFTAEVAPAGGPNWTLIGGIAIGLMVVLWLVWQQMQAGKENG